MENINNKPFGRKSVWCLFKGTKYNSKANICSFLVIVSLICVVMNMTIELENRGFKLSRKAVINSAIFGDMKSNISFCSGCTQTLHNTSSASPGLFSKN